MISNVLEWRKSIEVTTNSIIGDHLWEHDIVVALDEQLNFKGFMTNPVQLILLDDGMKYAIEAKSYKFDSIEQLVENIKEHSKTYDIYPYCVSSNMYLGSSHRQEKMYVFRFGEVSKSYGKE